jgi:hypothetical protein
MALLKFYIGILNLPVSHLFSVCVLLALAGLQASCSTFGCALFQDSTLRAVPKERTSILHPKQV